MQCEFLGIDNPGWPRALDRLRHDMYHRPEYARLDARRMQAAPEAFTAGDGERLFFVPYLVRRCQPLFPAATTDALDIVSPYGYPGILLSDAGREPEFVQAALAAFRDELRQRNVCSAFLRMHPLLGEDFPDLFPPGTLHDLGETVVIDLSLEEQALWKQMRQSHREMIRRRQKQGFAARFVPLADVLEEFLVIYRQTMDRVQAQRMYYFDREYFAELAQMEQVHCCVVESGSQAVAACLFFEVNGVIQYHLGGTLDEFYSKSPFNMTIYEGAIWAKRRGNRWLHLGGGLGGSNDTLLQFKAGFSPLRRHFHVARLLLDEPKYRQLVELRASALGSRPEALLDSTFFPAYRAAS